MILIKEQKVGSENIYSSITLDNQNNRIERNVNISICKVIYENRTYLFLYNSDSEVIRDAYRFINIEIGQNSYNTKYLSLQALKILFIYCELFKIDYKKMSFDEALRFKNFLIGRNIHKGNTYQFELLTYRSNQTINGILSENISIYTYRLINEAIDLMTDLSKEADINIRDYIFLYTSTNKIIKVIDNDSINIYLGEILKDVGLDKMYSLENLRDTYMSIIFDEGKKRGLSVEQIHPATGHKDITTTIKHYRNSDIRRYLEAFYRIEIGNVEINGTITKSISDLGIEINDTKSIKVSEDCGICKNGGCKDLKRIDCLICSFFVTTLNNIQSFKNRIKRLDEAIKNEPIEHDKEHLLKIKQLLLAYIERLYILKEELLNDTIKQN